MPIAILPVGSSAAMRNALPSGAPRVHRRMLLGRLCETANERVHLIQAPGGFGKTQLVLDWAESAAEHVAWVSIPEASSVEQSQEAVLDAYRYLRSQQAESNGDDESGAVTLRTVVIDGLDRVGEQALQDAVQQLMGVRELRIIITTRELRSIRLLGRVDPLFTAYDLEFSEAESAELARAFPTPPAHEIIVGLRAATAGWPLGTRNALLRAGRSDTTRWDDMADGVDAVARELVGDLLTSPDAEALLLVAVPERFLPSQSPVLLGDMDATGLLDDAERRALGYWMHDDDRETFVFQPMVRDFLARASDPGLLQRARAGLARWHLEREDVRAAFGAAVAARDWEFAHECALTNLVEVIALLSADPRLLSGVPKSVLHREPLLHMLSAIGLYMQGRFSSALAVLTVVVADLERRRIVKRAATHPDHVWVQGLITLGLRLLGRYEMVEAALHRFTAMMHATTRRTSEIDSAEDLFLTEAAVTALYLGKTDLTMDLLAQRPLRARRSKRQHFYGEALRVQTLVLRGEILQSREAIAALHEQALPPGFLDSFYAIPLHVASAYVHLEHDEPERALEALHRTEAHWATTENWPLVLLAHVDIAWYLSGAETALETLVLRRAEQHGRPATSPAFRALLDAKTARLLAATGRSREALALTQARTKSSALAITRAFLLVQSASEHNAIEIVDRLLDQSHFSARLQMELHVIGALAALRASDDRRMRKHVLVLERLVRRTGLRAPFEMLAPADREVLFRDVRALRVHVGDAPSYFAPTTVPRLTKKEVDVLHELNIGASLDDTARKYSVSLNTVKSQRRTLYRKLGVSKAAEALRRARELGLM